MTFFALATLFVLQSKPSLDLQGLVTRLQSDSKLVALGAAVQYGSKRWVAVAGERKLGSGVLATQKDVWHIGSNSKSWTATLAGIYVDKGKLSWTTKADEILTELAGVPLGQVTLWQLLTHTSGLPDISYPGDLNWSEKRDPLMQQRAEYVSLLKNETLGPKKFLYSNANYVLAGAVLERLTKKPWEQLVQDLIAKPLGLRSVGFGAAGSAKIIDQPWPHEPSGEGFIPINPVGQDGIEADNAAVIFPAGGIHVSLGDMLTYLRCHEGRGKQLVKRETLKALHTPADQGYAGGWGTISQTWSSGLVLNHSGSNTLNFHTVWVAPDRDLAIVAATNQGGPRARATLIALKSEIIKALGL
jgi:CubicO group peptidase (beta-lactamase class C family)